MSAFDEYEDFIWGSDDWYEDPWEFDDEDDYEDDDEDEDEDDDGFLWEPDDDEPLPELDYDDIDYEYVNFLLLNIIGGILDEASEPF